MIEVIIGFLLIPIVYWILFAFLVIATIYQSEQDNLTTSLSLFIGSVSLGLLKYGSFTNLFEFVKENPGSIIVLILLYLIIGIIWSFFKWYLFIKEQVKSKEITISTKYRIDVTYNKKKIINWIIVWVPSITWFLINDPIRRVGNFIYNSLEKTYQNVSDSIWSKVVGSKK